METDISKPITLDNGVAGRVLDIPTANPVNYYQAISTPAEMETTSIRGQLFLPASTPAPVVIVVPGSAGVAPSHLYKSDLLLADGIGAFIVDPFGTRGVTSTVADQTQYSFAASAWDVLCAVKTISEVEGVDATRIGVQGHSRGGAAVLSATCMARLDAVGFEIDITGAYAAYPWCGHQFLHPKIGSTKVRAVIGDLDEWCLPQQVQGQILAMRLAGGDATFKLYGGAHHSFDRHEPVVHFPEARVAPGAPTVYIADTGAFIHPLSDEPDPALCDRELMIYAMKTGHGKTGASMGSSDDFADQFHADMMAFWREVVG